MTLHSIAALVAAFLSGSIPTALILGRMKGVDLRKTGSGNIGATNAFRTLGKGWGIFCLLADAFKGWAPAVLTRAAPWRPEELLSEPSWMLLTGAAAIAGHCFSPWLAFKGGKGVATSLGVFLAVAPGPLLVCFGAGAVLIALTGYVSVASLAGSVLLPVLILAMSEPGARPWPAAAAAAGIGVFVIWKHRPNIQRLRAGNENKIFGGKRKDAA